ncbi:MAG: 30S ribosomal protein S9 [Patescibacteria group bacterium]
MEDKKIIEPKVEKKDYIFAVGRRKEAIAGVRFHKKDKVSWGDIVVSKGEIFVNKMPAEKYFGSQAVNVYSEPLRLANMENKFAITVIVRGGGKFGQLDAMVLGIARALNQLDRDKFRPALKKQGFLTRDSRTRERRKVGMGGKARRRKQSPKR